MKREQNWRTWETVGMLVTLLLGNGLHFLYDWTGQAGWAAYISAVNESTWEHMKLLAVPWILWTAVTCIGQRSLRCAGPRAAGLLAGLVLIPAVFYTYTGIVGKSVDVVNVLLFQAAVLLAYGVSRALRQRARCCRRRGRPRERRCRCCWRYCWRGGPCRRRRCRCSPIPPTGRGAQPGK